VVSCLPTICSEFRISLPRSPFLDGRYSIFTPRNNCGAYCTVSETEVVCCVPLAFPVIVTV
jgi:hypothetical protein